MHDIMISGTLDAPIMSDGATGPAEMVLTAACRRLYGSDGLSWYGFPGCRPANVTARQSKPSDIPSTNLEQDAAAKHKRA